MNVMMTIEDPIPSTLFIKDTLSYITISYPNQPPSCNRCGSLTHLIRDCEAQVGSGINTVHIDTDSDASDETEEHGDTRNSEVLNHNDEIQQTTDHSVPPSSDNTDTDKESSEQTTENAVTSEPDMDTYGQAISLPVCDKKTPEKANSKAHPMKRHTQKKSLFHATGMILIMNLTLIIKNQKMSIKQPTTKSR